MCKFFATKRGCLKGSSCLYKHECAGGGAAAATSPSGGAGAPPSSGGAGAPPPSWMRISSSGEPWSASGITLLTSDDKLLFVEHAKQAREVPLHVEMLGGSITPREAALGSTGAMLVAAAAREFFEELRGSVLVSHSTLAAAFDGGHVAECKKIYAWGAPNLDMHVHRELTFLPSRFGLNASTPTDTFSPEPPRRMYPLHGASFLLRTSLSSGEITAAFSATLGVGMSRAFSEVRGIFFLPFSPDILRVHERSPPTLSTEAGAFFIKARARKILQAISHLSERSVRELFYDGDCCVRGGTGSSGGSWRG